VSEPHIDDGLVEERLLEASRFAESGEEAEALRLLLATEPDHPEHATLLCMIGALAAHLDAEGIAVDFFHRCLAQNPTDPGLLVTAGAGLAAAGDPEAEPALRMAALLAPALPAARMHYGALLVRSGLLEQGLNELTTARDLDPEDAVIRRELAVGFLLGSRPADALTELDAAVAAAQDDSDSRLLLGLTLLEEGDPARAAEELYPLGVTLAHDGQVQLLLALLFALQGWENEAWLALSRAEAVDEPLDPALVRDAEEAIEEGGEAIRSLLTEEIAASLLRERLSRSP
jgi:Flp pilus assembly protein TadD